MNEQSAKKIIKLNKESYENIAEQFSITRSYVWPDLKNLSTNVRNNQSVLDIGCGNGRLYEELESKNVKYFGVDSCQSLIDIARERYKNTSPNAQFAVFDIFNLPFEKNSFDVIFAIAIINHIPTKKLQKKAIKKLKGLLKPGGLLLMTNWNLWMPTLKKKSILYYNLQKFKTTEKQWINKYGVSKKEFGIRDIMTEWKKNQLTQPLYYYAFSLNELDKIVKRNEFEILDSYYSKKGEKVNQFNGENIVTIARKN